MDRYCEACELVVAPRDYLHHVETFHVGSPSYEMVQMKCGGSCCFHVGVGKVVEMLAHCRSLGHRLDDIELETEAFVRNETARIRRLLQIASGIEKVSSFQSNKQSVVDYRPLETPQIATKHNARTKEERMKLEPDDIGSSPMFDSESFEARKLPPATTQKKRKTEDIQQNIGHSPSSLDSIVKAKRKRAKSHEGFRDSNSKRCALCHQEAKTWRSAVAHSMTHTTGAPIHIFKCPTCQLTSAHLSVIRFQHIKFKSAQLKNCDGTCVDIQNESTAQRIRSALKKAYPQVDWDTSHPPGSSIGGIKI